MAGSADETFDTLNLYLRSIPSGQVKDTGELEHLLSSCWAEFDGSNSEGMAGYKLLGRMKSVFWNPPKLTFKIERHGDTVQGSTRAGLHHWLVDMDSKSAGIANRSHRQLQPMKSKLDVIPLAEQVAELMFNHKPDERIKWNSDGSVVTVHIGKIIPGESTAKQTLAGRRKRFREALTNIVTAHGWNVVRANVYRQPDT